MLELRPLQVSALERLRDVIRAGHRRVMLYAPTGAGKTEMAIALMDATAKKGNRAAMVLDRVLLCDQTSARMEKYHIDHGVLQAGHWRYRPAEKIQVCSAQTLEARGSFPDCNMVLIDEAHTQRKETTEFARKSKAAVIGLSASPFTKGLSETYTAVVSMATTRELVDAGLLAPLRVFVAHEIDMSGAKKVAGEWSQKEAIERGIKITGDIVTEWVKKTHEVFGGPRKTIVFAAGVAHGNDLSQKFMEAGYNFISLSYNDDDEFKRQVIEDFSRPDTQINGLIATDILTKGFDVSDVMIGVSARPFSKSFSSHVQQMGRVMRAHPGKEFALWLDHSGNYLRFRDQWDELYSVGVSELLEGGTEKTKKEPTDAEKERAKCPKCGSLWPGRSDVCLHCGHVRARVNDVVAIPGQLSEIEGAKAEKYDSATKERWFHELLGYAHSHGFKDGWAFHKYIEKFGVQPAWKKSKQVPGPEVASWIKSRFIAYKHARKAA
jgi:DNA repair protein RadD